MTTENEAKEKEDVVVSFDLPETIRGQGVLVNFSDWVATHYPWRPSLHSVVRQRILDKSA